MCVCVCVIYFVVVAQVTFFVPIRQQISTFLITVLLVYGSLVACGRIKDSSDSSGAAAWISLTNIVVPVILRALCFVMEDHVSLNHQQLSLFLKLSFFRWVNRVSMQMNIFIVHWMGIVLIVYFRNYFFFQRIR